MGIAFLFISMIARWWSGYQSFGSVMYRGRIVEIARAARCLKTRSTPYTCKAMAAVLVMTWAARHPAAGSGRSTDVPGNIYKREEIASVPLQQVGRATFRRPRIRRCWAEHNNT